MDWLYVWSPRYRFFHELLFSSIKDLSGFAVKPVFAEQHHFKPLQSDSHFLTGIPIKIYVIINYIQKNMGKTFFFTDVDLIVFPSFTLHDLESYSVNDITCMKEAHDTYPYNIGCLLIQCNPETLRFFQRVLERIQEKKILDQGAFHQELPSFQGSLGVFSPNQFLQSNMLSDHLEIEDYKIIQCLSSQFHPTDVLLEKLETITFFIDTTSFEQFLPSDVLDAKRRVSQSQGSA